MHKKISVCEHHPQSSEQFNEEIRMTNLIEFTKLGISITMNKVYKQARIF